MHTKKQIIVAIGREHGSGGHYIAQMISRALGVRLYDKKSIEAEVVGMGVREWRVRNGRGGGLWLGRRLGGGF